MRAGSPAVTKQEFSESLCPIIAGHIMMANLTHRAELGELLLVNAGFSFIFSCFEGAAKAILCIISPSSASARPEMLLISQK